MSDIRARATAESAGSIKRRAINDEIAASTLVMNRDLSP